MRMYQWSKTWNPEEKKQSTLRHYTDEEFRAALKEEELELRWGQRPLHNPEWKDTLATNARTSHYADD